MRLKHDDDPYTEVESIESKFGLSQPRELNAQKTAGFRLFFGIGNDDADATYSM